MTYLVIKPNQYVYKTLCMKSLICNLFATTDGNVVDEVFVEHFTRNSSISTIASNSPSTYSASGLETNSPITTSID